MKRYTMKDMEADLALHNEQNGDTLEVYAAYGAYKVVRVHPNTGHMDAGRHGLQRTPREAMKDAGLSIGGASIMGGKR